MFHPGSVGGERFPSGATIAEKYPRPDFARVRNKKETNDMFGRTFPGN